MIADPGPFTPTTRAVEDWCLEVLMDGFVPPEEDGLADLTVVVPSYRRQDYLLRLIRYWARRSASVVIVDGSDVSLPDRVTSALIKHPRITYIHDNGSMSTRLRLAGRMITTPYAVMLGDDEFHLPSGLRVALSTLAEDPEAIGCMGQVVSFLPAGGFRRLTFHRTYRSMGGFSVRSADPEERFRLAFRDYTMATCYAVLRTPVWRRSWGSVEDYDSGHAAEVHQAMVVHLLGDFVSSDAIQWLRSVEHPIQPVAEGEKEGMVWFPEWWAGPEFAEQRSLFVATISNSTAEGLGLDADGCAEVVRTAAEVFVKCNHRLYEDLDPVPEGRTWRGSAASGLRSLLGALPAGVTVGAKRLRQASGRSTPGDYGPVATVLRRATADGLVVPAEAIDELSEVEDLVARFHDLRGTVGLRLGAQK